VTPDAPAAPAAAARDPRALEAALAAAGLVGARVRADGPLVLLDAEPDAFTRFETRAAALRLARAHGFTHVALVLPEAADGDGPATGVAGTRDGAGGDDR
jgi:hypothetical protein